MKFEEVQYISNRFYTVAYVIWSWKGTVIEYFGMTRKEAKAIASEFKDKEAQSSLAARFGGDLAYTI